MKKNRRILFQIGILIVAVFVLGSISASYFIFIRSKSLYLTAKNEMIEINLQTAREDINEIPAFFDEIEYWEKYADDILKPRTKEEMDIIGYLCMNYSSADFNEFSEKEKYCYAKSDYSFCADNLYYDKISMGYDQARCLVFKEDYQAVVIIDTGNGIGYGSPNTDDPYASHTNSEKGEDIYKYALGEKMDLSSKDHKALHDVLKTGEDKTVFEEDFTSQPGKALYIGYIPVFDDNRNIKCFISIIYDWTEVYTNLYRNTISDIIVELLIGLLFAGGLLLAFIYGIAIKPLQKVNVAVRNYMQNKDSSQVKTEIEKIKTRNEIGILADDISNMAQEIDRYTEENIRFATERERVETELNLASKIQSEILIKDFPDKAEYELYASMKPAREVGGDFYDFFKIGENHLGIVIADVSGKGIPAALLMMSAMTSIRNFALLGGTPAEILAEVNNDLSKRDIMDMFVTAWLGILNVKTGMLEAANAGHEFPIVSKNGKFELYQDIHGMVLGAIEGMEYTDYEIYLSKGDSIFLYTDGIAEANSSVDKLFGMDRIVDVLNKEPGASPEKMISNVSSAVDSFVESAEQFDDMTMMCMTYKGAD